MLTFSWPSVPLQSPRRGLATLKTPFATISKEVGPQQMEKESPNHTDAFLYGSLWEEHVIQHQVKIVNGHIGILPPQNVIA